MTETAAGDLFAPVRDLSAGDALEDWRWLTGPRCRPLLLTAMGDLFVERPARLARRQAFLFLDTMDGSFHRVASNYTELRELLANPELLGSWLLPGLVAELRNRGLVLESGQCYSPKLLPVLGGAIEPDNFEATDWRVHLAFSGDIHRQLRDLPDGTRVEIKAE